MDIFIHQNHLEIVGYDFLEHQTFSVVCIDNGQLSYHPINSLKTTKNITLTFITNHLPDKILSNHQMFNNKNTSVRVIAYTNQYPNISVSIHPSVMEESKNLNCTKINIV